MLKLIVVFLAAFVVVLQVFGDPARKPAVTRDAPEGLTLAAFVGLEIETVEAAPLEPKLALSDREAIAAALEAGKVARDARLAEPRLPRGSEGVEVIEVAATEVVADAPNYWFVSGSRVNLRQGPGTGNAVVTQLTLGTEAEVLDRQGGWVQIRTADGSVSGWMSGKFLVDKRPG